MLNVLNIHFLPVIKINTFVCPRCGLMICLFKLKIVKNIYWPVIPIVLSDKLFVKNVNQVTTWLHQIHVFKIVQLEQWVPIIILLLLILNILLIQISFVIQWVLIVLKDHLSSLLQKPIFSERHVYHVNKDIQKQSLLSLQS